MLGEVIAGVILLLRIRRPQVIGRQPATAPRRNNVGDDRTATHPLSLKTESFLSEGGIFFAGRFSWKVVVEAKVCFLIFEQKGRLEIGRKKVGVVLMY